MDSLARLGGRRRSQDGLLLCYVSLISSPYDVSDAMLLHSDGNSVSFKVRPLPKGISESPLTRSSPPQACALFQLSVDVLLVIQTYMYSAQTKQDTLEFAEAREAGEATVFRAPRDREEDY
jgi:hypothetical protein